MISRPLLCAVSFFAWAGSLAAARLDVLAIPGVKLRDNPLGDPAVRRVAVFVPERVKDDVPLPLVIYLPGWGGSSEDAIAEARAAWFGAVVDRLSVRIAVVDGRSRYGGSQFLNSTATGNYADYVSGEILPALAARYAGGTRVIAGHSSGAYGALLLAMNHHDLFNAVVALSPDSDFETTHKPLVEQASVRAVTPADIDAAAAAKNPRLPTDGLARLVVGLCANYAPIAGQPRRFEWLYDERGAWRPAAWQRWLDLDPLTLVRRSADAFAPGQRIYLDGAQHDEFGANIGARKIHEILRTRSSPVRFYESPGQHSDRLPERLAFGLAWALERSPEKPPR